MSDVLLWIVVILLVGAVAWVLGVRQGRRPVESQISAFLGALRSGRLERGEALSGELPALKELRTLLASEWAPRGRERDEVVERALDRIALYLGNRVRGPLVRGMEEGGAGIRQGVEAALDAVEDLQFFLERPADVAATESRNLVDLVQEVTREFTDQAEVAVKLNLPPGSVRVDADPEMTKDAVFLLLHNAADFGGGGAVEVTVTEEGGQARVLIRDRGPGFTTESLQMAEEPFFSTSPEGLGLGIPHARRAIRSQGGDILLRNAPGGGAEAEVTLPREGR